MPSGALWQSDNMVRTVFVLCFLVLCAALIPFHGVSAQETIAVRTGFHSDYSRLVFDFDKAPSYTITKEGSTLTLTLNEAGSINMKDIVAQNPANILSVRTEEGESAKTVLVLEIPADSKYRDLKLDERIILDIYNPPGGAVTAQTQISTLPEEIPQEKAADEVEDSVPETAEAPSEEKLTEEVAEEMAGEAEESEAAAAAEVPAIQAEMQRLAEVPPHVITLSTTRTFGLAAFIRNDALWIVLDNPEIEVEPKIAGPNAESFGEFDKFEILGGTAYRLMIPDDLYVYGEGGGFDWRIILTPFERNKNPTPLDREYDETDLVRGASLLWPTEGVSKALNLTDPSVGDTISVITVDNSTKFSGPAHQYVELERLHSAVGMAFRPKVDDLEVSKLSNNVIITRPGGLALARPADYRILEMRKIAEQTADEEGYILDSAIPVDEPAITTVYNFKTWQMGGLQALEQNQTLIMAALRNKEQEDQISDLVTLAKLNLANARNIEALGFMNIAAANYANMEKIPEFIALRGAANTLTGRYDQALQDFVRPELEGIDEIQYWKALALAGLEDWKQAFDVMPKFFGVILTYPETIQIPVALGLAEIGLRGGDTDVAEALLEKIAPVIEDKEGPDKAAWTYLLGELERQRGNVATTEKYWEELTTGKDDLYRAKAGLALTRLLSEEEKINAEQAIDRLESLRFAWRGDQLETLINFRLGDAYINHGNYLKGLNMMRNAAALSPGTKLGAEITATMAQLFRNIFADNKIDDLSALEAIALYDEFQELTPVGKEGDMVALKMAERLAAADLLDRSIDLLETQVKRRLQGEEKIKVGLRLAAIELLNDQPKKTLETLDMLDKEIGETESPYSREIRLMRARALSETGEISSALTLLSALKTTDVDALRLKADIAWKDSRWEDAAEAVQDLIYAEDISLNRPINEYQAGLVLRRAVALNLSGNRVALANMRERYGDVMKATSKAKLFDIVSRPRQSALIGGREALTSSIGEVDLFGEFLDSYKNQDTQAN